MYDGIRTYSDKESILALCRQAESMAEDLARTGQFLPYRLNGLEVRRDYIGENCRIFRKALMSEWEARGVCVSCGEHFGVETLFFRRHFDGHVFSETRLQVIKRGQRPVCWGCLERERNRQHAMRLSHSSKAFFRAAFMAGVVGEKA